MWILMYAMKFLAGLTKTEERTSNGSYYRFITQNSKPWSKEDGSVVEGSGMSKYESVPLYKHDSADLIKKIHA